MFFLLTRSKPLTFLLSLLFVQLSMAATLPTIVLVHGAWHTPPNYQSYADALKVAGFKVVTPKLPSCNGASPPEASFVDDVQTVHAVVNSLVEAGEVSNTFRGQKY